MNLNDSLDLNWDAERKHVGAKGRSGVAPDFNTEDGAHEI
jgi:hypothetical protein